VTGNDRLLAEVYKRVSSRKIYTEYGEAYDTTRPFGPDNIGAYPWQIEFHNAGLNHTERMLMAANRVGKTQCAAAEMTMHLIGEYPKWWKGKKFKKGIKAWCGAESSEASRDIIQLALLGREDQHGTGWIPADKLYPNPTKAVKYRQAGVTEVADTIKVLHSSGGVSVLSFKTYEQGRRKWQGTKLDVVWMDEEPPSDIYTEALTRTLDSKGLVMLTFTPLLGPSDVVMHFIESRGADSGIYSKNVGWDDAPHLGHDEKERLKASYPAHERETRASGTPMLGTGAVFPISDDDISTDPFEIPDHWPRINGIDFGIDHPGAGAFLAHDRDSDTIYVYDCYRKSGETPIYHAAAMKKHGDWIPTSWPHDGIKRDPGSGIALKDQYRKQGLFMLSEHAHYKDERGHSREAGVIEIFEYMRTGKFKVFSNLSQWFEEKRLYHRAKGVIVAERDDILSATRYAFVMRHKARTRTIETAVSKKPRKPILGGQRWNRAS
jgi:phage terminase large subunit-like protein